MRASLLVRERRRFGFRWQPVLSQRASDRAAARLTCLGGDDVVTDRELGDGAVLSSLRHEDVVLVAPASPLSAIFSGPLDAGRDNESLLSSCRRRRSSQGAKLRLDVLRLRRWNAPIAQKGPPALMTWHPNMPTRPAKTTHHVASQASERESYMYVYVCVCVNLRLPPRPITLISKLTNIIVLRGYMLLLRSLFSRDNTLGGHRPTLTHSMRHGRWRPPTCDRGRATRPIARPRVHASRADDAF